MWALVCIAHLWIDFCFTFPLKARRGLQIQNVPGKTPRRLTLRGVEFFANISLKTNF